MLKSFCVLKRWDDERGFSLVELMVAIAISALIIIGSVMFLGHTTSVAADNRDKTVATLEVQYVGFWISEDVIQAQAVELGADSGFPLTLSWWEWNGSGNETVTYYLEEMEDGDLLRLQRTRWVNGVEYGTSLVAEYLVPWSDAEGYGTRCERKSYDYMNSMLLYAAARVDRSEAENQYEIFPRGFAVWFW